MFLGSSDSEHPNHWLFSLPPQEMTCLLKQIMAELRCSVLDPGCIKSIITLGYPPYWPMQLWFQCATATHPQHFAGLARIVEQQLTTPAIVLFVIIPHLHLQADSHQHLLVDSNLLLQYLPVGSSLPPQEESTTDQLHTYLPRIQLLNLPSQELCIHPLLWTLWCQP